MPDLLALDWLGILAGTVAAFLFGALWYGALSKPWLRAARIDPADAKMSAGLLAGSFALLFVIATGLAVLLSWAAPAGGVVPSVQVAAVAWLGLTAAPIAMNHRYQGFAWDLTVIDALHWLGVLVIMAALNVLV